MTATTKSAVITVVSEQIAANAVAVMDDVVAVLEANAAIARMAAANNARKAVAMSAASAAQTSEALSRVVNSAMNSEMNNEAKARNSASHVHRVIPGNRVKGAARSVRAVNAVNETASSVRQWIAPSKTLRWQTRQRWLRLWAARTRIAQEQTQARKLRAASVENGVASAVAAMTAAVNRVLTARS